MVGTVLYGAAGYYFDSLFIQNTNLVNHLWISIQLGSYTYTLTTGGFLIALLFALSLFFGAAYGPWVGLLVGTIGSLAGDFIAAYAFSSTIDWRWNIGLGLMGFFASLAPFRTLRRYTLLITTFIASIVGALAIAIGIGGAAFIINWSLSMTKGINLFINFAPAALVGLVFFSFLLFIYNAIVSRG